MARKPNHAYEKRQRELAKKAKRDAKREAKRLAKEEKATDADGAPSGDEETEDEDEE